MKKRPKSVTVIAWILIASVGITLITTTAMINNPMALDLMSKSPIPIPLQYAMTYIGSLMMLVSGIAMLKGCNWARLLFVIWSAINFLVGIVTSPVKGAMIPGFVLVLIAVFFLFRPKSNEYFSTSEPSNDAQRG